MRNTPARECKAKEQQQKVKLADLADKKETVSSASIPRPAQSAPAAAAATTTEVVDNKEAERASCSYKEQESELAYTNMEDID